MCPASSFLFKYHGRYEFSLLPVCVRFAGRDGFDFRREPVGGAIFFFIFRLIFKPTQENRHTSRYFRHRFGYEWNLS